MEESVMLIPHSGRPYGTDTSWQRHDHARRQSSNTAIASFAPRVSGAIQSQSQDGCQVEEARLRANKRPWPVAFRKHTLLPLDDCLFALQATIPQLTRSSLHRLFQRHDISRPPEI